MDQLQSQSTGEKILSTGYKVHGWGLRVKAITTFILGLAFMGFGIFMAVTLKSWGGLTFSVIGIIIIFGAWIYWKRSKSLTQGRFY
jgi:K+ transporter